MNASDLVEILKNMQDLPVRIEGDGPNLWVEGVVEHPTGESGYEVEGEIVLTVKE